MHIIVMCTDERRQHQLVSQLSVMNTGAGKAKEVALTVFLKPCMLMQLFVLGDICRGHILQTGCSIQSSASSKSHVNSTKVCKCLFILFLTLNYVDHMEAERDFEKKIVFPISLVRAHSVFVFVCLFT